MPEPLLEIKNLTTEFRTEAEQIVAINDVSFTLHRGETIGVVGESGSGKSVTALSIMRLIPGTSGKITGGEMIFHSRATGPLDLVRATENEMRALRGNEIGMIFQEPMTSLNPVFTCGDQVIEVITLHQKVNKKEAEARTIELFREVQLPRPQTIFQAYPHQVSGGQKQRVMIAMAIACNPSVLIADEPTTALDVSVQHAILELMKKLQAKHRMGIIFITHDLGVIAELADKVAVMYKGKIVEQGTTWNIFSNPKHPYTKGLLACRPPLNKRLHRLPTISDFMTEETDGNFSEIKQTVDELTCKLRTPSEEREQVHKKLYAQEPLLKVCNLKAYFSVKKGLFGKTADIIKAVDDVSFDVYPGETMGLVGESGCGKTTLGRTLLRLIEPTGGNAFFENQEITGMPEEELRALRKDIQIIFQDPYSSLNPRLPIGEAIMEPMIVHNIFANNRERKNRVMELLQRVNLNEQHFYRYPHEFSGGQRQRICIARALSLNPKFIICDEAVSALDVSIQAQVLNLLNELKEEFHFTSIFISHDLSVVKFMADRMMVMNQGKIVEEGDADEIYLHPKTDYTKRLINSIPKGEMRI